MSRFDYIKYDSDAVMLQGLFKKQFEKIENLGTALPDGRWKSLFHTHLEYAYWAVGKAIRDHQIERMIQTEIKGK